MISKKRRESALSALVRSIARFVNACALLMEALAERAKPGTPRSGDRGLVQPSLPVSESPPALRAVPPLEEDLLPVALRRLGYREAEVREMAARATGGTLEARVKSALARRSA